MNTARSIEELARQEVIALHDFFVGWFRGTLPETDFPSCERAFAADFTMVEPSGEVHGREEVLKRIHRTRGALPASFRIEILTPHPVWSGDSAVLLEYVEQQYRDGRSTMRRSTGLFTSEPSAPRGVSWRHLQETWIGSEPGT